jgi:ComF family protein
MEFLRKTLGFVVDLIIDFIINLVIPEGRKAKKLLALTAIELRELLPKSPTRLKDIIVLFDYRNKQVKNLVKEIKYRNNLSLKKRIALYMHEEIVALSEDIALFDGSSPVIVPMPMSKKEKTKRGFNQCEELVREIEILSKAVFDTTFQYNTLEKVRETKRQTELDRRNRESNVKNSMLASGEIQNRVVIIVDDVYTTLATFREAERALLASGAKRVLGLFIAH